MSSIKQNYNKVANPSDLQVNDIELSTVSLNDDSKKSPRAAAADVLDPDTITISGRKMSQAKLRAFANSAHRSSGSHVVEDENVVAERAASFVFSHGLTTSEAQLLLEQYGRNELPEKTIPKWYIFASQLWQPMPLMIWVAAIVEAAIENWPDMAILFFILFANATIGFHEITKAGDAVAALKASLKPSATVKRDGKFVTMDAALLVPGDLVLLASGSAIPADCRVNEGEIEVDEAALTGESLPVTKFQGSDCKMGSTVVKGEVEGTVEATGAHTFFGKTAALLENNNEMSNFQKLLMTIVLVLVVIAVTLCIIVLVYLLLEAPIKDALGFSVGMLVASIPLAVEIVTTTTLALGSKELSREGAIVARLAAIEDLASMAILCSDKTGTLTMNKMMIQEETPVFKDGETQYSLLRYAAMAAKWKEPARDALDTLTLTSVDMASLDKVEQLAYMPFDPIVKRTEGTVRENGQTFKTTKGAPHVLLNVVKSTTKDLAAFEEINKRVELEVFNLGARGVRSLAVAKTNANGEWEFLGLLTFLDPPRPDTKHTIEQANKYGVAVKMITGDHLLIAKETARVLGLGDYVKNASQLPLLDENTKKKPENLSRDYGDMCLSVDAFAQVFPEHKYLIVECLRELGYKIGMTGDGVNDAPALKRADVGVAVDGATDAARAAADIVLTQPGLSTIVEGIIIARRIFKRIQSFLTYRIASSLQLVSFFFIALFAFKPNEYMPADWETDTRFTDSEEWPKYFHLPVLLIMLITLLNDGTLIAIGYDNAPAREAPEKWNPPVLFTVASVLAAVSSLSSLLLLYFCLSSWEIGGTFDKLGLRGLSYGQIITVIYMQVSIQGFLALFSARTGEGFFWTTPPSGALLGAGSVAVVVSTVLGICWPQSTLDNVSVEGMSLQMPHLIPIYVWIYCLLWWWVQDLCKVLLFVVLKKYNVFGYNNTGALVMPESALKYINDNKEKDLQDVMGVDKKH